MQVHPSKLRPVFSKYQDRIKEDFSGKSPAPFVGKFGYPHVNVGIMATPEKTEDAWKYDAPRYWAKEGLDISQVAEYRSSLINSRFLSSVHDLSKAQKLIELSQEIGMASKPVDVEINLEQKPFFRLNTDDVVAPSGPNARLKKAIITANPKIDQKVDKIVSDTDLKATGGLTYLYDKGFDENFLTRLLSIGNLGVKESRKLVPTRWSITAVDDTLGKSIIDEIKNYPETGYYAFTGGHLGNYYIIMTFPEPFRYELFESYAGNEKERGQVWTDYEGLNGRKDYASVTVGGYYAARLPIVEKLKSMKRRGSVLALRFITDEYYMPLGVWVVREAVRKTMESKPIEFGEEKYMLKYAEILAKKKFGYDINPLLQRSRLMKDMKAQRSLKRWV